MGKVRRVRQKYHLAAAKNKTPAETSIQDAGSDLQPLQLTIPDNLFAGVDIPFENLKQNLKESDVRSIISNKSTSRVIISKKEKRKLRHEVFLRKLQTAYQTRKEHGKKKQKLIIKPLLETIELPDKLPSVELNLEPEDKKDKTVPVKRKGIAKAKHRRKNMLKDIAEFNNLFTDVEFKLDPVQATTWRVQEKVYKELDDES